MKIMRCLVLLTVIALAPTAQAAIITYDESIDGDLPRFPTLVLPLDIGLNTVSGTFGTGETLPLQFDSFGFTVPVGTELIDLSVSMSNPTGGHTYSRWDLQSESPTVFLESFIASVPGPTAATGVPLVTGPYSIRHHSYDGNTADYTFTLEVQSIPEPSSFACLVVGGLCGVGLMRRRFGR